MKHSESVIKFKIKSKGQTFVKKYTKFDENSERNPPPRFRKEQDVKTVPDNICNLFQKNEFTLGEEVVRMDI